MPLKRDFVQHCAPIANSPREINDNAAPRYEKQLKQFGFDDNLCQPYGCLHFFRKAAAETKDENEDKFNSYLSGI